MRFVKSVLDKYEIGRFDYTEDISTMKRSEAEIEANIRAEIERANFSIEGHTTEAEERKFVIFERERLAESGKRRIILCLDSKYKNYKKANEPLITRIDFGDGRSGINQGESVSDRNAEYIDTRFYRSNNFFFRCEILGAALCHILDKDDWPYLEHLATFLNNFIFEKMDNSEYSKICASNKGCSKYFDNRLMPLLPVQVNFGFTATQTAIRKTQEAVYLVNAGEYEKAIYCLKNALNHDPTYADAYNELAFIFGKFKHDWGSAKEAVQKAIAYDPSYPKYSNSLVGILVDQLRHAVNVEDFLKLTEEVELAVANYVEKNPGYPPAYLALAQVQVLRNENYAVWTKTLNKAKELYTKSGFSVTWIPLNTDQINMIIEKTHNECEKLIRLRNELMISDKSLQRERECYKN